MTEINRFRGDTKPIVVTLWQNKKTNTPYDLTGCTVKFTVDPEKAPADSVNNLFTLIGTDVTDGTDGKVQFVMTEQQADISPGTYYYDIELEDALGHITTCALDKFKVNQDITKA